MSVRNSNLQACDPDHVYYNVVIDNRINPNYLSSPATFAENRTTAIINNPSDWYMTVIRFYVPAKDIPLTVLPILPYPNTNPNMTTLSVILSYNGINSNEIPLIYVPSNQYTIAPPAATTGNPIYPITNYYYIYSYQQVIDIANTALAAALTNLKTKPGTGAIAAADAPYFTYDAVTQLITLNANVLFYDPVSVVTPIKIYGNLPFTTFFQAFPFIVTNTFTFNPSSPAFQYNIKDTGTNVSDGYINFVQEFIVVGLWNIFKSLVFITGTVPINGELIPAQDGSGNTIGRRITTDYDPLINDTAGQSETILQYYPQGPYRLISLQSNAPLTKFDITVYWQDKNQNLYNLYIPYNNVLTIKILFVRKSVYNANTK
jgi:hypothetical protein